MYKQKIHLLPLIRINWRQKKSTAFDIASAWTCDCRYVHTGTWDVHRWYVYDMPITPVVSSNLDQGEVYNIMWSRLSMTCDRSVVFSVSSGLISSTNKTDHHDLIEILLKVTLINIKPTQAKLERLMIRY
jgi:hypothetical protein